MTLQQAFFITGTDTGVGKTHVTCALLHASRQRGWRALGMKPVAAGVETDGHNTDVTQLQAASSVLMPTTRVNPFPVHAAHCATYRRCRSRPADCTGTDSGCLCAVAAGG